MKGFSLKASFSLLDCNNGNPLIIANSVFECHLQTSIEFERGDVVGVYIISKTANSQFFDTNGYDSLQLAGYRVNGVISSFEVDPLQINPNRVVPLVALEVSNLIGKSNLS